MKRKQWVWIEVELPGHVGQGEEKHVFITVFISRPNHGSCHEASPSLLEAWGSVVQLLPNSAISGNSTALPANSMQSIRGMTHFSRDVAELSVSLHT